MHVQFFLCAIVYRSNVITFYFTFFFVSEKTKPIKVNDVTPCDRFIDTANSASVDIEWRWSLFFSFILCVPFFFSCFFYFLFGLFFFGSLPILGTLFLYDDDFFLIFLFFFLFLSIAVLFNVFVINIVPSLWCYEHISIFIRSSWRLSLNQLGSKWKRENKKISKEKYV